MVKVSVGDRDPDPDPDMIQVQNGFGRSGIRVIFDKQSVKT
jgi:hypothetical protein